MSRDVNIFTMNIRRMNIRRVIAGYNRTLDQSIPVDINSLAGIEIVIRMISHTHANFAKLRAVGFFAYNMVHRDFQHYSLRDYVGTSEY
ncbi:hypothetical protein ALC62_12986 [Cyphomyrmex costatus]|uniref:Uncharacterized protein n=1 Tax=Cyphomyrmex costatus TaxID=456900 RepID=A0A195C6S1_9HYME|nr:hypothetical protein ALC62_12986 [Cyphomyrmex costatus]